MQIRETIPMKIISGYLTKIVNSYHGCYSIQSTR